MAEETFGPLLTVATFCERILDEKDGTPSIVRLIDRITFTTPPLVFDREGKPIDPSVELAFFVRLSSRNVGSTNEIRLTFHSPLEEEKELARVPVTFEPERSGVNLRVNLTVGLKHLGFCWVKVYLDGVFTVQVPLEILKGESTESGSKK